PGTYTFYAECSNSPGCRTATNFIINARPTVTVNSSTVCAGGTATVKATPGAAGTYTYVWTVPAGVSNPGNVASFTTTVAGTYTVEITNTVTTCVSAPASGTVTVKPLPTAVLSGNAVICRGQSATLTITLTGSA